MTATSLPSEPEFDPRAQKLFERLQGDGPRDKRYRLLGKVAEGGMGAILRVWDEELRRTLAMKVVLGKSGAASGETPPVDPKTLGRFLEEAETTGQLDHPGIVPVHELGLDANGRVYFTMKLVKGQDLKAVASCANRKPSRRACAAPAADRAQPQPAAD